jgi:hypothetical protein
MAFTDDVEIAARNIDPDGKGPAKYRLILPQGIHYPGSFQQFKNLLLDSAA